MSFPTAEAFFYAYAERSGIDPIELASWGRRAYRCSCDYDGCEGWAMLDAAHKRDRDRDGIPEPDVAPNDDGWAPA